jgi:hypothetical protein
MRTKELLPPAVKELLFPTDNLTSEEKRLFKAFMNPKYPNFIRSLNGLASEAGLSLRKTLFLLSLSKHGEYIYVGQGEFVGKFHLDINIFNRHYPTFLWGRRN